MNQAIVPGFLLLNAAILGFRHGIDWDHIAAIMDIIGAVSRDSTNSATARAFALSTVYALGHAFVVGLLGLAAFSCKLILPEWIDPIMQRLVGLTLLYLGGWISFSLIRQVQRKEPIEFNSKWMLLLKFIKPACEYIRVHILGREERKLVVKKPGTRTAFGIGMIHGIGAETGTQILFVAAMGGASSNGLGLSLLFSFLLGLVLANTLIAILGIIGFMSSSKIKYVHSIAASLAACFSIGLGCIFLCGHPEFLPEFKS